MLYKFKLFLAGFFAVFIFLFSFLGATNFVSAQEKTSEINFFYSTTCPHCLEEERFLNQLEKKYPEIEIKKYEFSKNIDLANEFYSKYKVSQQEQGFVPLTFIGDVYFVGFDTSIGNKIEQYLEGSFENGGGYSMPRRIPFLGEIDTEKISLPLLAVIFGFFDGFNICSLGALVLILGIVITLKSRRKILILGGAFIVITAVIYWVLVFLWNRLFVFLAPYLRSMEMLIGILAAVGAWYFFREFWRARKYGAVCKFGGISEKLAAKVSNMFEQKRGILVMIGIVFLFAAAITIMEFPCTAFFPVLFTGILAQAGVPLHLSVIYIGIYVFFYMLDELIVLIIAAFTMKIWIASPKIMKWLNLVGALMLFVFGFYYLLWPTLRVWFNF